MPNFTETLASRIDSGLPLEGALAELRSLGATPVETIKAIHAVLGVDLAEAKTIFSASPAWAREVEAGLLLQEEALAILAKAAEP